MIKIRNKVGKEAAAVVAAAVRAVGPCRRVREQALLARVAGGMREWRRSVAAELDDKNKK